MYYSFRMRLLNCRTSFSKCNNENPCWRCFSEPKIIFLETKIKELELKIDEQNEMVLQLLYKQNDQYMQQPF
jgi:hypothetical protein